MIHLSVFYTYPVTSYNKTQGIYTIKYVTTYTNQLQMEEFYMKKCYSYKVSKKYPTQIMCSTKNIGLITLLPLLVALWCCHYI